MNGEELRCTRCGKPLGYSMMDGRVPEEVYCRTCFARAFWHDPQEDMV